MTATPEPFTITGTDDDLSVLLESYYWCGRSWEAWQYKTMTEEDFEPAAECVLPAELIAWRDAAVAAEREKCAAEIRAAAREWYGPGLMVLVRAATLDAADVIDPPRSRCHRILRTDESARCSAVVETRDTCEPCGEPSRFVVSRSDGDQTYGISGGSDECCEGHLAETVTGMTDGDAGVNAIVAIRWDAEVPR